MFDRAYNATDRGDARPEGTSPHRVEDLLGNLREWTASTLRPYPYRADDGREPFTGVGRVVVRGASHDDPAGSLHLAARRSYDRRGAAAGHHHVGFRCATSEDLGGYLMTPPIHDLMMDYPLTLTHFFERSRRLFARKTLATRRPGQALFRYTYADFAERTFRLAGVLRDLGVRKGDRVATLAWNSHRHLELYWAIPLSGAVLHTLNFRLSAAGPDLHHQPRGRHRDLRGCQRVAGAGRHPRPAPGRARDRRDAGRRPRLRR